MKVLVVGATGALGSAVAQTLAERGHEVIRAGRTRGDLQVDITSDASVEALYAAVGRVDAIVSAAGGLFFGPLNEMRPADFNVGLQDKLLGQVRLALLGQHVLTDGGSITLTTGIVADEPIRQGANATAVNAAVEGFVRGAAIELPRGIRINVVSPTVLTESLPLYGSFFPGFESVSAAKRCAGLCSQRRRAADGARVSRVAMRARALLEGVSLALVAAMAVGCAGLGAGLAGRLVSGKRRHRPGRFVLCRQLARGRGRAPEAGCRAEGRGAREARRQWSGERAGRAGRCEASGAVGLLGQQRLHHRAADAERTQALRPGHGRAARELCNARQRLLQRPRAGRTRQSLRDRLLPPARAEARTGRCRAHGVEGRPGAGRTGALQGPERHRHRWWARCLCEPRGGGSHVLPHRFGR